MTTTTLGKGICRRYYERLSAKREPHATLREENRHAIPGRAQPTRHTVLTSKRNNGDCVTERAILYAVNR